MVDNTTSASTIAINEVQLLLAEKRTSLAVMRTGIAILALPVTIASLLIVTSRYYDVWRTLQLLIPVALINLALTGLGAWLVVRSVVKMRRYERMIVQIKNKHSMIQEFID
ncbi:hypothetical protein LJC71_00780 [Desulfosarcina sp. OttesenSCG-928-A07]|nr:hypothetical protein [Desulfosarcina sp. OttesenSCG-928-G17]MDL2328275.1 hypothetical protein [Desulfosarcina sp. OttesenSCG-928-A07]